MGDDIMVTRQARNLVDANPGRLVMPCVVGACRWSPVYDNNPILTKSYQDDPIKLEIRPRLYIERHDHQNSRFMFKRADLKPGEIYLTEKESSMARASASEEYYVYIEPNVKGKVSSENKSWGLEKYQHIVNRLRQQNITVVQCGVAASAKLKNVRFIETNDIRSAFGILSHAAFYLGNEGGMHHAAAAFGLPAVVVFGGFISPYATGYESHTSIYVEDSRYPYGCGNLFDCSHCKDTMRMISIDQVYAEVEKLVERTKPKD